MFWLVIEYVLYNILKYIIYIIIYNAISFDRGPQSEKLQFGALWGACGPRTPFTPRTSFKGKFVIYNICVNKYIYLISYHIKY